MTRLWQKEGLTMLRPMGRIEALCFYGMLFLLGATALIAAVWDVLTVP